MRKILRFTAFCLSFLLLFSLFSCAKKPADGPADTEGADEIKTAEGFVFRKEGEGLTLTGYTGTATAVTVPASAEGLSVCAVSSGAFYGNKTVEEIHLPATVKTLPPFALAACPKLTVLTVDGENPVFRSEGNCILEGEVLRFGCRASVIPASAAEIGAYAFYGCDGLEEIEIPGTVRKINEYAFAFCDGMKQVSFAEGLEEIGENAFYYCTALAAISLPSSVSAIGTGAFSATVSVKEITAAPGGAYQANGNCLIRTDGGILVAGCRESVIPKDGSVKEIGREAFYGCVYLKDITIPASVCVIRKDAFSACYGLETAFFEKDGWQVSGNGSGYGTPVEVVSVLPETGHPMTADEVVKGNALLLREKYNKMEWCRTP